MLSNSQKAALLEAEKRSAFLKRKRSGVATIDFDAFVESPPEEILVGEFVKTSHREMLSRFIETVEETTNE